MVVLVIGLAIGRIRGGSMHNMAQARLRFVSFVFLALGLQLAGQFVPASVSGIAFLFIVVSYAAMFGFAGVNYRVPGMAFIALGALCNYVVILANGGMPISADAAARVGFHGRAAEQLVVRGKHFIAGRGEAKLEFLGDVIPLWRQPSVASVGDLIIWAGMILLIQALMLPRARRLAEPATEEGTEPVEHPRSSRST